MDAKLTEIYGWDIDKIGYLEDDMRSMLLEIEEVKNVALDFDEITSKFYLLVSISGGKLKNKYEIIIRIEKDYPSVLPYCFEKSNNFSKETKECFNRHITQEVDYVEHSIKGSFCMLSPLRVSTVFKKHNKDAYNTVNLLLVPHLEIQEYYTEHGEFPQETNGAYSHGFFGLEESLKQLFPSFNEKQLTELLRMGINGELVNDKLCFCGSGKYIQRCHAGELISSHFIDFNNEHVKAWYTAIKQGKYKIS